MLVQLLTFLFASATSPVSTPTWDTTDPAWFFRHPAWVRMSEDYQRRNDSVISAMRQKLPQTKPALVLHDTIWETYGNPPRRGYDTCDRRDSGWVYALRPEWAYANPRDTGSRIGIMAPGRRYRVHSQFTSRWSNYRDNGMDMVIDQPGEVIEIQWTARQRFGFPFLRVLVSDSTGAMLGWVPFEHVAFFEKKKEYDEAYTFYASGFAELMDGVWKFDIPSYAKRDYYGNRNLFFHSEEDEEPWPEGNPKPFVRLVQLPVALVNMRRRLVYSPGENKHFWCLRGYCDSKPQKQMFAEDSLLASRFLTPMPETNTLYYLDPKKPLPNRIPLHWFWKTILVGGLRSPSLENREFSYRAVPDSLGIRIRYGKRWQGREKSWPDWQEIRLWLDPKSGRKTARLRATYEPDTNWGIKVPVEVVP